MLKELETCLSLVGRNVTIIEERRLTPAGVAHYTDRLEKAIAERDRVNGLIQKRPDSLNLKAQLRISQNEIALCNKKLGQ